MSLNNTTTTKNPVTKDDTQSSGAGQKAPSAVGKTAAEQSLKCPRCDSPNTKFCYYNNYSLTQPRHFCKTCRRYWTKGGALRNVPIGGGCRKNKKIFKSSTSYPKDPGNSSADSGGFKFFNGITPAMDFQLGGMNITNSSQDLTQTRGYSYNFDTASSSSVFTLDPSATASVAPLMGFNFGGSLNIHNSTNNNLASSIESLSSINQDLHWKLQQQRLAVLLGAGQENQRKIGENNTIFDNRNPQPILFENLEIPKQGCVDESGNSRTEWFFDSNINNVSFAPVKAPATTVSSSTMNEMNGSSWSSAGFQPWGTSSSNLNQYSALP